MKDKIHPKTRLVIFEDAQTKEQFLIESTVQTKGNGVYKVDGKEYPMIQMEVTSDSHPFYTGQQTYVQAQGRVERFNRRYNIDTKKEAWKYSRFFLIKRRIICTIIIKKDLLK